MPLPDDGRTLRTVPEDEFYVGDDSLGFPNRQREVPSYARQACLFRDKKKLIPETVYIRSDNQFTVTAWESVYSSVFVFGKSPFAREYFAPIVDDRWKVVGHLGWADGNDILVPAETLRNDRNFWKMLQKRRLDHERQQLLDEADRWDRGPFPNSPFRIPSPPPPPPDNGKVWRGPEYCVPRPHYKETIWEQARRGPLKEDEPAQHLHDLASFIRGGGKAFVGRHFGKSGYDSYVPLAPGVPGEVGSPRKPFSSAYELLVLVDPDGNIQGVVDVRSSLLTQREKDAEIFLGLLDIAMTVTMIIDIVPIAVVLFRLGRLVAKEVMIQAIRVSVQREAKEALEVAAREVAETALRAGAMSGPEQAEARTAWQKLRNAFWDAGKTPPKAIQGMSKDQVEAWNKKIAERMKKLGIPENNIGVKKRVYDPVSGELQSERPMIAAKENGDALNTSNYDRGGNMRSFRSADEHEELGISVHGNVFDDWQGFDLWNQSSVDDRIDAIIAHEWSEFNELSHWETVELAPETKLPVTERAREILRYMRIMGKPEMAFTEFAKAEWEAIVKAGKATASIEEKLKIAATMAAQGK